VNETTRSIWLFVGIAVALLVSYLFFFRPFIQEEPKVRDVINANSTWSVTMQEYELTGPLSAETFRISNDNGKGSMFYAATNRAGTVTKEFTVPLLGPQGTFLFEELRADGIWELDDKPLRPNPKEEFIIEVDQTLGDQGGTRSFGFSDPYFWATTHAQEYQLKLPHKGRLSSVNASTVGLAGRKLQDTRYLLIVQKMRYFGPPNVLAAENKIRLQLADTAKHPIQPR
jgi:hypothetical protein